MAGRTTSHLHFFVESNGLSLIINFKQLLTEHQSNRLISQGIYGSPRVHRDLREEGGQWLHCYPY